VEVKRSRGGGVDRQIDLSICETIQGCCNNQHLQSRAQMTQDTDSRASRSSSGLPGAANPQIVRFTERMVNHSIVESFHVTTCVEPFVCTSTGRLGVHANTHAYTLRIF